MILQTSRVAIVSWMLLAGGAHGATDVELKAAYCLGVATDQYEIDEETLKADDPVSKTVRDAGVQASEG
jgi:hypothetical protein